MAGFDVMKPMEERVDPNLVNDYLVHRFSIAGNPKECIERIEELKAAGVEHLMLTPARKVYRETDRSICSESIPALPTLIPRRPLVSISAVRFPTPILRE